jgi:hypothetical protein
MPCSATAPRLKKLKKKEEVHTEVTEDYGGPRRKIFIALRAKRVQNFSVALRGPP